MDGCGRRLGRRSDDFGAHRPYVGDSDAATGAPTITGAAQVDEMLTTSGVEDADGLDNVSYSYQWIRSDGNKDADIAGETASTYTPVPADVGKAIKVKVSFTDDAGNEETLTSAATGVVAVKPNSPATGAPTISGTAQVGQALTADTSGIVDEDGLTSVSFSYQWIRNDGTTDTDIEGATSSTHALSDADEGKTIRVSVAFTDDRGDGETLTSEPTAAVAARSNSPPTSLPTISGTVQVGETLTADTSGIADEDGLTSVSYGYQWVRGDDNTDADIAGETASTYTLDDDDEGKTIRVRVSFTDDADNEETLTSAATAAVEARPNSPATGSPTISGVAHAGQTLSAETSDITDSDGLTGAAFSYQWISSDGTTDTDIEDADDSTHTVTDDEVGRTIRVRVTFDDDRDNAETLTGGPTAPVSRSVIYVVDPTAYPTNLVAEWKSGSVRLSWYAPGLDTDPITGYIIYRDSRQILYLLGSGTRYRDSVAAEPGSEHTYCVAAVRDGTDYSECSNDASVNVPAETLDTSTADAPTDTALRHPMNLAASLLDGVVVLTWEAPVEEAESITGYEVVRRRPQNGEHTLVPYGQTTVGTTFIDLNATESGVKYVLSCEGAERRHQEQVVQLRQRHHTGVAFRATGPCVVMRSRTVRNGQAQNHQLVNECAFGPRRRCDRGPAFTGDRDAQGAVRTGDGRKLSNRLEFTVAGAGG